MGEDREKRATEARRPTNGPVAATALYVLTACAPLGSVWVFYGIALLTASRLVDGSVAISP